MFLESAICFEYIVKNDRSVLELIDADYTFLNGRLKKHYGFDSGRGGFTKVQLNGVTMQPTSNRLLGKQDFMNLSSD